MTEALATVVVVPRERFSYTEPSLESIIRNTGPDVPLIYVDGGSPPRIRRYLEGRAREKGFQIVRTEYYLSPNEARNLGLARVAADSRYVVFIDNDVIITPGWLDEMVGCAEETGAWLVGPLYLIGRPEEGIIHMAGGEAGIKEQDGVVYFHEEHRFPNRPLREVESEIRREATEIVEFHCILVRKDVFDRLGPLDEGFVNTREHVDLCIAVRNAGGTIYLAPEAVAAYVATAPFTWWDIPYYLVRWNEAWSEATISYLNEKWGVTEDHYGLRERFLRPHRRRPLMPVRTWARRLLGGRMGDGAVDGLERLVARHGLRRRQALKAV